MLFFMNKYEFGIGHSRIGNGRTTIQSKCHYSIETGVAIGRKYLDMHEGKLRMHEYYYLSILERITDYW